jgi:hypothetical protein
VIDIAHTVQRQGPPAVRLAIPSGGAAASRAIREITLTIGCLLILPDASLV